MESLEDPSSLTMLEREQHPFWKSDLSKEKTVTRTDGRRIDDIKEGDTVTISDGTLSMNEDGTIHCKSEYLGNLIMTLKCLHMGIKNCGNPME